MGAVASWHDGSIGGNDMAKKVNPIDPEDLQKKALELISLVRRNQNCKPADQVDHTVSVVQDDNVGIMICGSAHRLEDCFYRLIQERPEIYFVIDNALSRYAHKGMR